MNYTIFVYEAGASGRFGSVYRGDSEAEAVAAAWEHHKTDHGPMSMEPHSFEELLFNLSDASGGEVSAEMTVRRF